MKEFGAPLENLTSDDFAHEGYFYQTGRPPLRVDIMMSIPGIEFDVAWQNREVVKLVPYQFFPVKKNKKNFRLSHNSPMDNGVRQFQIGIIF